MAIREILTAILKIVTAILIVATAVICVPYAFLAFALLIDAPNQSAHLYAFVPWLLIFGTWFIVWQAWRAQLWLVACFLPIALLGLFGHWWLTLDLP